MSGLVSSKGIVSQQPSSDVAYGASWNGDLTPPSKNAVYDKIETVGGGTDTRVDNLEYNLGVNSLRDAVNGGYAYFNMVGGVGDVYTDETGVDTGAAANQNYNAAGDYYGTSATSPSTLLIDFNGTDGSTVFTDTKGGKTITANGDAQVDTAQSQFGSASAIFDGAGDFLSLADSDDWSLGNGDFTIDCWIRIPNVSGYKGIVGQYGSSQISFWLFTDGANIRFSGSSNGTTTGVNFATATSPLTINTWHHVALVRSGNDFTIYVNGTSAATTNNSITFFSSTAPLTIGVCSNAPFYQFNGHIDEFRFLKGTAAWTTGFTAPTQAYVGASTDMTLPSIDFASGLASVSNVRPVMLYEPITATTLNTDLILEVSRDSGTTWAAATLETDAAFSGAVVILVADEVDITGQPAGTTVTYRVRTLNGKEIRIHGVYLQWR